MYWKITAITLLCIRSLLSLTWSFLTADITHYQNNWLRMRTSHTKRSNHGIKCRDSAMRTWKINSNPYIRRCCSSSTPSTICCFRQWLPWRASRRTFLLKHSAPIWKVSPLNCTNHKGLKMSMLNWAKSIDKNKKYWDWVSRSFYSTKLQWTNELKYSNKEINATANKLLDYLRLFKIWLMKNNSWCPKFKLIRKILAKRNLHW